MARPENLLLFPSLPEPPPAGCPQVWGGRIVSSTFLGAGRLVGVMCDNGVALRVLTRVVLGTSPGDRAAVGLPEEQAVGRSRKGTRVKLH